MRACKGHSRKQDPEPLHLGGWRLTHERGLSLASVLPHWPGKLVLNQCPLKHSPIWDPQVSAGRHARARAGSSQPPAQQAPAGSLGLPNDRLDMPRHPSLSTNGMPHSTVSPASGASLLPTRPDTVQGSTGPTTGSPGQRPGSAGQVLGSSGQASGTPGQGQARKHLVARKRLDSGVAADREQEVRMFCCKSRCSA